MRRTAQAILATLTLCGTAFSTAEDKPAEKRDSSEKSKKAERTPKSEYMREVNRLTGPAWTNAIHRNRDIPAGDLSVKIRFVVDAKGALKSVEVSEKSKSDKFDAICLDVFRNTKFPAPPAEILTDGVFTDVFTFLLR